MARRNGLDIPVVYNSSGYEKTETLKLLEQRFVSLFVEHK